MAINKIKAKHVGLALKKISRMPSKEFKQAIGQSKIFSGSYLSMSREEIKKELRKFDDFFKQKNRSKPQLGKIEKLAAKISNKDTMSVKGKPNSPDLLRREKIARHQAFINELNEKRKAKEVKKLQEKNIKQEIKSDYLAEAAADKKKGDVLHDLAEKGKQKVAADKVKPNVPKPAPVEEEEKKELLDMQIG